MLKEKSLALAMLLFVSVTSFAQSGPPGGMSRAGGPPAGMQRRAEPRDPEKVVEEEVKWMKKKLKLSDDQLAKMTHTSQNYVYAQDDLRNSLRRGGRPSLEDMQKYLEKQKELEAVRDREARAVLNDKQYKQYLKKKEQEKAEEAESRGGQMGGRQGGPPSGMGGGRSGGGGRP